MGVPQVLQLLFVRAMCQDYCLMFEHYLGWFTVTNPTQDNQVVEEIMEIMTVLSTRDFMKCI